MTHLYSLFDPVVFIFVCKLKALLLAQGRFNLHQRIVKAGHEKYSRSILCTLGGISMSSVSVFIIIIIIVVHKREVNFSQENHQFVKHFYYNFLHEARSL